MQRLINQRVKLSVKFTAKLFLVISIIHSRRHAYKKTGSDLRLIANHPVFSAFFQLMMIFNDPNFFVILSNETLLPLLWIQHCIFLSELLNSGTDAQMVILNAIDVSRKICEPDSPLFIRLDDELFLVAIQLAPTVFGKKLERFANDRFSVRIDNDEIKVDLALFKQTAVDNSVQNIKYRKNCHDAA